VIKTIISSAKIEQKFEKLKNEQSGERICGFLSTSVH
jgi:hypothetical protein